ncbi:pentapeptide repeat-containing protein [Saccharopolyspora shandongensis]|uniref:pentapeptide repeat-containing protein n=1 Tax=Saccharopolyspora shandongensis TaxID=418495 RepID=UPI0033E70278
MIDRRPRGAVRQRAVKSARPVGLGLRHPAGTKSRRKPRLFAASKALSRRGLDLTQILTLGAVLATLALAIPQYIATRSESFNTQQQQLTERFSKAVEQLGTPGNLEVRIGGIYSLERIARDSEPDHPTVINVLATFVRENTKILRDPQGNCPNQPVATDVQTALTVLIRRDSAWDDPASPLDFTDACLQRAVLTDLVAPRADFSRADLTDAILTEANLTRATLRGADLTDAILTDADLTDANFADLDPCGADPCGADLTGADLAGADLTGAVLTGADLTGAVLIGTTLTGAYLVDANLTRASLFAYLPTANLRRAILTDADLTGADLTRADLTGADLTGADLTGVGLIEVRGLTREQVAEISSRTTDVRGIPPAWLPQ